MRKIKPFTMRFRGVPLRVSWLRKTTVKDPITTREQPSYSFKIMHKGTTLATVSSFYADDIEDLKVKLKMHLIIVDFPVPRISKNEELNE